MPTPRRAISSQLLVTTGTAIAVVALYLYLTHPSTPVIIHQSPLHDQLARPITVSFHNRPLTEAIAAIATDVGLPIDVDWPALATMGVTPEQPITSRLKDVPAHAVLSMLLAQMRDGGPIVWAERSGRLAVGHPSTVKVPVVRVYEVADLAHEYATFARSLPNSDESVLGPGGGSGYGAVQMPELATLVSELLVYTVDPDTWIHNGGSIGRIEYKMNRLVIAQTPENHEKILRILLALRLRDTTETNTPDRSDP